MKKIYIGTLLLLVSFVSFAQKYTWNAPSSSNWSITTNWTPTRSATSPSDTLIFDGSVTPVATAVFNVTSQSINQLRFVNGVNAIIRVGSGSNRTLNIANGTSGIDFFVSGTSSVIFNNVSAGDAMTLTIGAGKSGQVDGSIIFDALAGSSVAHQLLVNDASGLIFSNGSSITYQGNGTGNLFGSSPPNYCVIFTAGSKYISKTGANPFGPTTALSKVLFQKGSLYSHQQPSLPAFTNRTYANFELDAPTFNQSPTGNSPFRCDTFTVKHVNTLSFDLIGGMVCSGNFTVLPGAGNVFFAPLSPATIMFDGNVPQSVSGAFTFTTQVKMVVAKTSTVNLQTNINTYNDSLLVYGKLNANSDTIRGDAFYLPPENLISNFTGSTSSTNGTIGVVGTPGFIHSGMEISGTNIPAATYVMKIVGNLLYLSRFPTASASGSFTAKSSRGTLGIGHPDGIYPSPVQMGNIWSTERYFNTEANYEYNGNAAQSTGFGLPDSVKNLSLDNSNYNTITLNKSVKVDDTLILKKGFLYTSGGMGLLLRDTTAISSPASNYTNVNNIGWEKSFIFGPITRQITGTYTAWFPVGKIQNGDTSFAPIAVQNKLTNPIAIVDTAEYFPFSYNDLTVDPGQLDHVSSVEHWQISSNDVSNNSDAKITLSWRPKSKVSHPGSPTPIADLDSLVVTHYLQDLANTGFKWRLESNDLTSMAKNIGANANYGVVTTNMSFSPRWTGSTRPYFTLGTRNGFNDLPLTLLDFTAVAVKKSVALNWITREEKNVIRYEIEKSSDGRNFTWLATENSLNSQSLHSYRSTDNNPVDGWNYYRLKVTDQQNKISYSSVVRAWIGKNNEITVYPNPAQKEIKINLPFQSSTTEISIVNSGGQVVKQVRCNQLSLTINIETLNSGLYFIYLRNNQQAIVQRFIKE